MTPGRSLSATGRSAWTTVADLCRWLEERFAKRLPPLEHDPGSTADGIFPPEGAKPQRRRREGMPKRRSASKKGASRHPLKRSAFGASRQARVQLGVSGMIPSARRQQGPGVSTGGRRLGEALPPATRQDRLPGPTSSPPCARTPATVPAGDAEPPPAWTCFLVCRQPPRRVALWTVSEAPPIASCMCERQPRRRRRLAIASSRVPDIVTLGISCRHSRSHSPERNAARPFGFHASPRFLSLRVLGDKSRPSS